MNKLVKIRLNKDEVKEDNFIYLVGGVDDQQDGCYTHGLSIFYNGQYVLNFILSEDDVEALTSDIKVKFVKDLGFTVYTYGYNLEIMKYVNVVERGLNQLENRISDELKETQTFCNSELFDTITFISDERDAFAKGLKEALLHPVVGSKTYIEAPCNLDEIVEF